MKKAAKRLPQTTVDTRASGYTPEEQVLIAQDEANAFAARQAALDAWFADCRRADEDIVSTEAAVLPDALAAPYVNTHYLDEEQRRRAFRLRARAHLTGEQVAVRHFDPAA